MAALLELVHVTKLYGEKIVFKNVCHAFEAGSVTLLTGDNGSGKSTLLRVMAGLSLPLEGEVRRAALLESRGGIGYVGHATFLYPALTALENLAFWNRAYGMNLSRGELLAGLEHVGLVLQAHERVGVFSRGMEQRLNLARVFLQKPALLLLDEPGTGLDQRSLGLLQQEIIAARDRGACVVLISHDIPRDAPLADERLLLNRGRLAPVEGTACSALR